MKRRRSGGPARHCGALPVVGIPGLRARHYTTIPRIEGATSLRRIAHRRWRILRFTMAIVSMPVKIEIETRLRLWRARAGHSFGSGDLERGSARSLKAVVMIGAVEILGKLKT